MSERAWKHREIGLAVINVVRVPSVNGEWLDIHAAEDGSVWLSTTGYVKIDPETLTRSVARATAIRSTGAGAGASNARGIDYGREPGSVRADA